MAEDGLINKRYNYYPFGELIASSPLIDPPVYNIPATRQRYAGMYHDGTSELEHTLWRKYDSSLGQWTTPDPYNGSMSIGDPQSFNRYSYVENDPVNLVDPSGLKMGLILDWYQDSFGGLYYNVFGNGVVDWNAITGMD